MAAGLGLLVIIASGILLFLLFSGIGDEAPAPSPTPSPTTQLVSTPDFVGLTEASAIALAEQQGVVLEMDYHESADHEAGLIIDQLPEPQTEVSTGTTVQVMVATQVETVVVPDVHGIREEKAIALIEDSGLAIGTRFDAVDPLPRNYVISTEPRAGASATRGSAVDYVVSTGPSREPTPDPVRTPAPVRTPTPERTPGTTASPTPFPSAKLVLVGDFAGLELSEARGQLADAGLLVGATYPEDPPPADNWIVRDQLPEPGSSVPLGSAVDLVLCDPLEPCPPG